MDFGVAGVGDGDCALSGNHAGEEGRGGEDSWS